MSKHVKFAFVFEFDNEQIAFEFEMENFSNAKLAICLSGHEVMKQIHGDIADISHLSESIIGMTYFGKKAGFIEFAPGKSVIQLHTTSIPLKHARAVMENWCKWYQQIGDVTSEIKETTCYVSAV